ncbi:TPA: carbonate dehydratase, partial [Mannheimia haemolytica]|nr:carbonate dehydratase [Mannheimia haemolytica]
QGVMATSRETLEITYRNAIAKITTEANEKIVLNDEN